MRAEFLLDFTTDTDVLLDLANQGYRSLANGKSPYI